MRQPFYWAAYNLMGEGEDNIEKEDRRWHRMSESNCLKRLMPSFAESFTTRSSTVATGPRSSRNIATPFFRPAMTKSSKMKNQPIAGRAWYITHELLLREQPIPSRNSSNATFKAWETADGNGISPDVSVDWSPGDSDDQVKRAIETVHAFNYVQSKTLFG